jgi:hypothetical protein
VRVRGVLLWLGGCWLGFMVFGIGIGEARSAWGLGG